MAAEMLQHGEDFESSIEQYERNLANYKEKGFNQHAAQAMAVESLEDGSEQPKESTRFAGSLGEAIGQGTFEVPEGTSGEDIAAISKLLTGEDQDAVYMNGKQIY